MSYSERISQLRIHFVKNDTGMEHLLGLSGGYFSRLKKEGGMPHKLLYALSANGISVQWFLTGEGPMTKPPEPGACGTGAQGAGAAKPDIDLRDYFAGQYLIRAVALKYEKNFEAAAADAYRAADAMIAERQRGRA
jgi:hypothetical protein